MSETTENQRPQHASLPFRLLEAGMLAMIGGGLVLQLLLKDRFRITAPFFYALPLPVLGVFSLFALLLAARRRSRRRILITGMLAALVFVWWPIRSCSMGGRHVAAADVRVMFWNTMHNRFGAPAYAEHIRAVDADVVGLVEAPVDLKEWQDLLPGYAADGSGSLKLFVKGRILKREANAIPRELNLQHWTVEVDGRQLQVFLVDFEASPWYDRSRAFAMVREEVAKCPRDPVIVMGDFNTPRESVHCTELERLLQPAPPAGLRESWPFGIPVLSLDQVWVGGGLTPVGCGKRRTWRSDHAAVIVAVQITPQTEGKTP